MHALGRIHRSLSDHGVLLDLHPEPKNSRVEVGREGQVQVVGEWDQEEDIRDIRLAREQLDLVEKRGALVRERQTGFDILEHFRSVEDWLEWRTAQGSTGVIQDELLDRARHLLATEGNELIIREPIRASLLRRSTGV